MYNKESKSVFYIYIPELSICDAAETDRTTSDDDDGDDDVSSCQD